MITTVTDIAWDTRGDDDLDEDLPSTVVLDAGALGIRTTSQLCDWLSDAHGWTVLGLCCTPPLPGDAQEAGFRYDRPLENSGDSPAS